jgi:hypothetical protein
MAKEPGSIGGVIAVATPAGLRQQVVTVRTPRTHDTQNPGSGPVTVRPESDPHHATEA